jgi:hypothetical protein
MANRKRSITADSLSGSFTVSAFFFWALNTLDEGLFRPLSYNAWRLAAGEPLLLLDHGALLRAELGTFSRWWLVIGLAVAMTASLAAWGFAWSDRRVHAVRWLVVTLTFALATGIFWPPFRAPDIYDWTFKMTVFVLLGAVAAFGVAPLAAAVYRRFANEPWNVPVSRSPNC